MHVAQKQYNSYLRGTYLTGRHGNSSRIHRHHGSQHGLAQEGRHENGTNGGGERHQDTQRHISTRNIRAQVGRLSTVDGSHQNHTRQQGRIEMKGTSQRERQNGHHGITQGKLHKDGRRFLQDVCKIFWGQGDSHGKHERGESSSKVLGREPGKALG
jgi:hypothetical protein